MGQAQKKPYIKGSEKDLETNFSHGMLLQLSKRIYTMFFGVAAEPMTTMFSLL